MTTISTIMVSLISAAAAYSGTNCIAGKMYAQQIAGCYCEPDSSQCINTAVTCGSSRFKDTAKNKVVPANPVTACCTNKAKCSTITCAAGDKQKAAAADLLCAMGTCATTGAASDRTTCCENDSTKCKYSTVACGTVKYKDSTKDGTTAGISGVANCCINKAKCSTYSCPTAGKKQRCNAGTLFCAGSSCVKKNDEATCCMDDEQKCRGASVACAASRFKDSAKYGTLGTSDASCCTNRALCTTITCPAGQKKITAHASTYCATSTCSTTAGTTANPVVDDRLSCCVDVVTECKGASVTCAANKIKDPATYGTVGSTDLACCKLRATCNTVTCDAGMKRIGTAPNTYCAGLTCTTSCTGVGCTHEKLSLCCENNPLECKGAAPACPSKQFLATGSHGTAGTNIATCCTNRQSCTSLTCSAGKKKRRLAPTIAQQARAPLKVLQALLIRTGAARPILPCVFLLLVVVASS